MLADPQVTLGFAVTAGASATNFTISSSIVNFDPLNVTDAYATAAISITDLNSNGASITGLYAGDKCYEARYNATSTFESGTLYAGLVDPFTAPMQSSGIGDGDTSDGIAGPVYSIASQYKFTLSARDQASGTSTFEVVPEPGAASLLAVGVLSLLSRRRGRLGR
jgi:hypothetical protein